MTHILGISGSLRRHSHNTALLRAALSDLPDGVTAEIVTLEDIPMYNWDDEHEHGYPPEVVELRDKVADADAILFATPEYNQSITPSLKNAIDWLSRGRHSPLDDKPMAIIGAAGGGGSRLAQRHLRDILSGARPRILAEPEVMVTRAARVFDECTLSDDAVRTDLREVMEGLTALAAHNEIRPQTHGSVVILGPDARTADLMARHAAEHGYRTLETVTALDAIRVLTERTIAAVVMDASMQDAADLRAALVEHHPGAPLITVDDARLAGAALDLDLRAGLVTR